MEFNKKGDAKKEMCSWTQSRKYRSSREGRFPTSNHSLSVQFVNYFNKLYFMSNLQVEHGYYYLHSMNISLDQI